MTSEKDSIQIDQPADQQDFAVADDSLDQLQDPNKSLEEGEEELPEMTEEELQKLLAEAEADQD